MLPFPAGAESIPQKDKPRRGERKSDGTTADNSDDIFSSDFRTEQSVDDKSNQWEEYYESNELIHGRLGSLSLGEPWGDKDCRTTNAHLPLQNVHFINVHGLLVSKQRNDNGKPNRCLSRCNRDDEKN